MLICMAKYLSVNNKKLLEISMHRIQETQEMQERNKAI